LFKGFESNVQKTRKPPEKLGGFIIVMMLYSSVKALQYTKKP